MSRRRKDKKKGGFFRGLKRLIILVLVLALAWFVCGGLERPQNYGLENPMRKTGDRPILIAHGGGNREFPDNTLEAFYNAYSVDPNVMMETDVSITRDGVIILSHDTTLDRRTNVTGAIIDWNYADLMAQKVDFGYTNPTRDGKLSGQLKRFTNDDGQERTPLDVSYPAGVMPRHESVFLCTTLEDLLRAFPDNRINVEIKQEGELGLKAVAETVLLLEKYNAFDRVVLASFHDEVYQEYLRLQEAGEVPECFMYSPSIKPVIKYLAMDVTNLDFLFKDGMCVFQLPMEKMGIRLDQQWLVDSAHAHNLAVHYWTVNDVDEMQHLIDIGADGIMTDYPHRLKMVLDGEPAANDGPTSVITPGNMSEMDAGGIE